MDKIRELRAIVEEAEIRLGLAKEALHHALIARAGVKLGDIVTCTGGRLQGQEFRVHGVDTGHAFGLDFAKPWIAGNPKRKDGSFSDKQIRQLYTNWEVKK